MLGREHFSCFICGSHPSSSLLSATSHNAEQTAVIYFVREEKRFTGYVRHGAEVAKAIWTLYHLLSGDAIKTVQICSGNQIPTLFQRLPVNAHSGPCL